MQEITLCEDFTMLCNLATKPNLWSLVGLLFDFIGFIMLMIAASIVSGGNQDSLELEKELKQLWDELSDCNQNIRDETAKTLSTYSMAISTSASKSKYRDPNRQEQAVSHQLREASKHFIGWHDKQDKHSIVMEKIVEKMLKINNAKLTFSTLEKGWFTAGSTFIIIGFGLQILNNLCSN